MNTIIEPLDPYDPDDPTQFSSADDLESPASESGELEGITSLYIDGEQLDETADVMAQTNTRTERGTSSNLMFNSDKSLTKASLDESTATESTGALINDKHRAKKGRLQDDTHNREEPSLDDQADIQPISLPTLPLDILLEILDKISYPGDLLAVARTCKDLCRRLTDPSTYPTWRKVRNRVRMPDPATYEAEVRDEYNADGSNKKIMGVENFVNNEPAYAAFVFDGGSCEGCGQFTNRSYRSFSLRIRLCGDAECREKIKKGDVITWSFTNLSEPESIASIVPVLEFSHIFGPQYPWDSSPKNRATRVSLLKDLRAEDRSLLAQRTNVARAKNDIWMKFCVDLFRWNQGWQGNLRNIRSHNESQGKQFAVAEGWDYSTLVNQTSFGRYRIIKYRLREKITEEELEGLRPTLARELYPFQQKKEEKKLTRLQEANINDLWKFYQKLMSHPDSYPYLPPFAVFLGLPAITLLQSLDMAKAGIDVKSAVAGKSFTITMLEHQIQEWVGQAKRELLETLGSSPEWNSMVPARRMPHPVERLDARWKCRVCNGVEPKYELDECLDFAGLCRHQCQEKDKKKKRKGVATRRWAVGNFVKDEQACAIMKQCLQRLYSAVDEDVAMTLTRFERTSWRCMTCNPPLILRAQSVIGHSHRHVEMEVEHVLPQIMRATKPRPNFFGLARWLTQKSKDARLEVEKMNFGCLHCTVNNDDEKASTLKTVGQEESEVPNSAQPATIEAENPLPEGLPEVKGSSIDSKPQRKRKEFVNKFNFNGFRSHLSSKHGIHQVRDEDFWCYQRIDGFHAKGDMVQLEGLWDDLFELI